MHMIDLRKAENFWPALEEAGGSPTELSRRTGLALRTIHEWKRNLEMGRVFHDGRWVSGGRAQSQNDGSREPDNSAAELLEYLKSRPKQPKTRPPRASLSGAKYAKEVAGFDLHAPFHHRGAWEVFLSAIDFLKPDGVTLGGDILDLAMISSFTKKPSVGYRQMKIDIEWAREEVLGRINTIAPDATKTLILGNHEGERWERYLWERCPEIAEFDCLTMDSLLGLQEMGWRFEPDGYDLIENVLTIQHGDRHTNAIGGASAMSARKEMMDTGLSGVSGHTHHLGKFYRDDNAGYRAWLEAGCLCDRDLMRKARVTARKRGRKKEDWHLGFAVIYHKVGGDSFFLMDIPILTKGKRTFAIVNETEIEA